jgi:hypothetical protein
MEHEQQQQQHQPTQTPLKVMSLDDAIAPFLFGFVIGIMAMNLLTVFTTIFAPSSSGHPLSLSNVNHDNVYQCNCHCGDISNFVNVSLPYCLSLLVGLNHTI